MWTFRCCTPSNEKLVRVWERVYHSLQHLVSCLARLWYSGQGPGPWVLTLKLVKYLIKCHFKVKEYCTIISFTASSCCNWSWIMQTSLIGSPTDNLIVGSVQQDGQMWACENAFLGLNSELTIGIWAGSPRETLPQATFELTLCNRLRRGSTTRQTADNDSKQVLLY